MSLTELAHSVVWDILATASEWVSPGRPKPLDECHLVDEKSIVVMTDHFLLHSNDGNLMSVIMFLDFVLAGSLETINLVFV